MATPLPAVQKPTSPATAIFRVVAIVALLFIFLVGIKGLGGGFKMLGKDLLGVFFAATENPFVSLVVGILATTLVQSSSVTTSMIVALVAAPENALPIGSAVPMIMGANIGTTVTNTIASLAHMGRREEFRRAFAAATCHDFFNFLAVTILLPLEIMTGYLQKTAATLAGLAGDVSGLKYKSPLKSALKTAIKPINAIAETFDTQGAQAVVVIILSAILIFFTLALVVKVMRTALGTRVEVYVGRVLGANALVAMFVGVVITVMVQSSSITTSLMVPLAGAGLITLRHAFPITLGANIGTTVTALLASLAVSGANAHFGVQIALVHLLFNLSGIILVYPIPAIRNIPLGWAEKLAEVAIRSKRWAIIYVASLFYGLPALLVAIHKLLS